MSRATVNRRVRTTLSLLAGALLAAGAVALGPSGRDPSGPVPPPAGATTEGVWDLLHAQPFRLAEPVTHWWRAERPQYTAGHLLVLAVDRDVVFPRQVAEPVLYVGDQTAERVNAGHLDGALVVVVPSEAGPDGWPVRDLSTAPIWFGTPALPEQVDARTVAAELERALGDGAIPFGMERVALAIATGGAGLDLADGMALRRRAARLVLRYAPSEDDLANGLLVR